MSESESESRKAITLLVVDDHPVFRQGLEALLEAQSDMRVVGAASDGPEALEKAASQQPDVVLLDLRLDETNGLAVLTELKQMQPAPKVLIVSSHEGDVMVTRALKTGADGYVAKNAPSRELLSAIRKVNAGGRALSRELARKYSEGLGHASLTARETQILEQVARGLSNKEVGAELGLVEKTVKNYLNIIFMKLDASDRTHAVITAIERGIIDLGG